MKIYTENFKSKFDLGDHKFERLELWYRIGLLLVVFFYFGCQRRQLKDYLGVCKLYACVARFCYT